MSLHLSQPPGSDPLLTLQEAADFLRVSVRTIQRRIADGSIRPLRLGGTVRIPFSEIIRHFLPNRATYHEEPMA